MLVQELDIRDAQRKIRVLSKALAHGQLVSHDVRQRVALINFAEAVLREGPEIIPHSRIEGRVTCRTAAHYELRDSQPADGRGGIAEGDDTRARINNQSMLRRAALIMGIREKLI